MRTKSAQIVHQMLRALGFLALGFTAGRLYQRRATAPRIQSLRDALRTSTRQTTEALRQTEDRNE